jgi:hypothetical protein
MTRGISDRRYRPWLILGAAMLLSGSLTEATYADEGGVSFWLPGQFGSLAAAPGVWVGPGPQSTITLPWQRRAP